VLVIGGITALFMALIAIVQYDIKARGRVFQRDPPGGRGTSGVDWALCECDFQSRLSAAAAPLRQPALFRGDRLLVVAVYLLV